MVALAKGMGSRLKESPWGSGPARPGTRVWRVSARGGGLWLGKRQPGDRVAMRVTMLPRSKTRQALHTVRPHGTLHPQGIARHFRVMRQRQVSEILTAKVKMAEAQRTARGGQEDGSE